MSRQHLTPYHFTWTGFLPSFFIPTSSCQFCIRSHFLSKTEKAWSKDFLACNQQLPPKNIFICGQCWSHTLKFQPVLFILKSNCYIAVAALLLSMNYCLWSGHWASMVSTECSTHGFVNCSLQPNNLLAYTHEHACTDTHMRTHTPLLWDASMSMHLIIQFGKVIGFLCFIFLSLTARIFFFFNYLLGWVKN